ncbi:mediator of RNA polymerase II transcription subunit 1.1 [Anopheles moucheti]|uniref:mediator of RNA polymerase II transcription subunit 1.1 n=1 Tax=Anopheles moucheti TaxID=186751 RepID=UPI0022F106E1|nr:mediator of RNA polymerase II transcription subunit 1.1 [Anopheles moucheti]
MTLPEALLKRLAKRGIIPEGSSKQNTVGTNETHPPKGTSIAEGDSDPDRDRDSDNSSERSSDENGDDKDDVDEDRRETEAINEEIIAEDYDEYDQVNPDSFEYASKKKNTAAVGWTERMKQKMTKRYGYQSVDGCQNKYNIYHLCTMYCVKRFGEVEFEIEKEYEKRVKRLLERYPLPKNWRKEYDIGCKAFYFYNKDTRVVSWLPPTHPDAKLTKSAKLLRRELMEEQKQKEAASEATPPTVVVESYPPTAISASKPLIGPANTASQMVPAVTGPGVENLKPPVVNPPKRPLKQPGGRDEEKRSRTFSSGNEPGTVGDATISETERDRDYRDRNRDRRDRDRRGDRDRSPARGEDNRFGSRDRNRERDRDREYHHRDRRPPRGPPKSAPLDPMDPAAYSDIPRGTWSAGLETASSAAGKGKEKDERKTKQTKQDDQDGADDDEEGAHEVLKISAVKEFHQEDEDDDEMD